MNKPVVMGMNGVACAAAAATAISILGPALAAKIIAASVTCLLPGIAGFSTVSVLV